MNPSLADRQERLRTRLRAEVMTSRVGSLARAVLGLTSEEAVCRVYEQGLPTLVNAELAGIASETTVPLAARRHFAFCPRCLELHLALLETGIAQMHAESSRVHSPRKPDLSFLD